MLLHRLILLVMLIRMSSSEPTTNCDSMACFAPGPCVNSKPNDLQTMVLFLDDAVLKDTSCEAIVKIRSYTKHHLLMVMESYKTEVTRMELNQGEAKFECIRDGDEVKAKYKEKENLVKLITSNGSLLSCEFEVNAGTEEIFKETSGAAKLISSFTTQEYKASFNDFRTKQVMPTCDPEKVKTTVASDESKTAIKVDARLGVLKCEGGYDLMFRKIGDSKFSAAATISCKYNFDDSTFGYVATPSTSDFFMSELEAQCEATTCKLCAMSMAPATISEPRLEEYKEGDCTLLRCTKGRMKLDTHDPQELSAKCENENNTPVWKLNGETIKKDSNIACIERLDCSLEDAKNLCPSCIYKPDHLPFCLSSQKLKLEGHTVEIEVFCNHVDGKFQLKDLGNNNQFSPSPENKLKCVDNLTQPNAAQTSEASSPLDALIYVFAAIVVIGLIVGAVFGYRFYMKKKQNKTAPKTDLKTAKENKESKSKESKSKESKSVNESKKDATPADSKKTPETPADSKKTPETPAAAAPKYPDNPFFTNGPVHRRDEEGMTELGYTRAYNFSGGAHSKKNEESVRRKGKKNGKKDVPYCLMKNGASQQQETETEKETEAENKRLEVMADMLAEVKKQRDDQMKGKGLDATQQSGGQSEGKSEGKDKPTAVIPAGKGAK